MATKTSVRMEEVVPGVDEFDSTYSKLFGRILKRRRRSGSSAAPSERNLKRLREVLEGMSADGGEDDGRISCLFCLEGGPRPDENERGAVVLETRSEYNLLKSLEILGNLYSKDRQYGDAKVIYNLACAYYEDRFDSNFVKSRDLKRKVAMALVDQGDFEGALVELEAAVKVDAYDTDLEALITLCIKHAYGRCLLSRKLRLQAVPYLCPEHLGCMDFEIQETMALLESTILIAMEQLSGGENEVAMCLAMNLLDVFAPRLQRGDCPIEIIDFAASFSIRLRSKKRRGMLVALHSKAVELDLNIDSLDSNLLASTIGCCCFDKPNPLFDESVEGVVRIHFELLSRAERGDESILRRLSVTTRSIYKWAPRDQALKSFLESFDRVSEFLSSNDPYLKSLLGCFHGRL